MFIVMMGHGGIITDQSSPNRKKEYLLTADGHAFFYKEGIRQILDNRKYPWLIDKPKIAIIQACRGRKEMSILLTCLPRHVLEQQLFNTIHAQ